MNKKSMISIAVASVLLLSGLALAGIDPQPFRSEINQLGAVANILNSALNRIEKVMGVDPEPFEPHPNLNGALNRLEAIDNQLVSANDMVISIAEEVMGVDPVPFYEGVVTALEGVKDAAQSIVVSINLRLPVDDTTPFGTAVRDVRTSAQKIVDTAQFYIDELSGEPPHIDCSGIKNPDICNNTGGACVWVDGDPGFCTDS